MEKLTIDLIAPEGNIHAMVAKAYRVLSPRQASELLQRFEELTKEEGSTYQDVKNLVSEYCAVTWLNTPEEVARQISQG
jgi:hypothetical protein